jgi:hypothetical protein
LAVPPVVAKKFKALKNSKGMSTLYGYCADFTTSAGIVANDTFAVLNDVGVQMKKVSIDTITQVRSSKAYHSFLSNSAMFFQNSKSQIENLGTGMKNGIKVTAFYRASREKLKKFMAGENKTRKTWLSLFQAHKDPCQKWVGTGWYDKFCYNLCSAWKKGSAWELLWPETKKANCEFCFW